MDPRHPANFCGTFVPFTHDMMAMNPEHHASFCSSSIPFTLQRMTMDPRPCANFCGSSIPLTSEKIPDTGFRSSDVHRSTESNGVHLSKPNPKLLSLFPERPGFKKSVRRCSGRSLLGASKLALSAPSLLAPESVPQNTHVHIPLPSQQIPLPSLPPVDSFYNQSSTIPFVDLCKEMAAANQGQCLDGVEQLVSFNSRSNYQYNETSNTPMLSFGASAAAINSSPLSLTCSLAGHTIAGSLGPLTCPLVAQRTEELLLALTCPLEDLTTNGHLSAHSGRNTKPSARHRPRPGVTYYKRMARRTARRMRRWETHIWNKGKQIYLAGASTTAERASRAYDRAAIHFRTLSAELNFCAKTYTGELLQLVTMSEPELVTMLRNQSAGAGTEFPVYPPGAELRKSKKPRWK